MLVSGGIGFSVTICHLPEGKNNTLVCSFFLLIESLQTFLTRPRDSYTQWLWIAKYPCLWCVHSLLDLTMDDMIFRPHLVSLEQHIWERYCPFSFFCSEAF